ncbi:16S rRNA (cytidine(1402)-2'-O)-methyltransferase [bacterium]|nr:MAG: 16S rRNA (cytidine(1402)-2'-O)-methyltransferase [bacterium]
MTSLYIVSTPIGNLKDITLRALEIMKSVDFVACEDTRETSKILKTYEIQASTISFHQHSAEKDAEKIIERLKSGENGALVTDAGTPNISDPGAKLVQMAIQSGITVVPIPGPSALTTAISASALDVSKFQFLGFPPTKKGRQTFFKKLSESELTTVMYESTHRIIKTLEEIKGVMPDCQIEVFRELTKKFETIYRGTISEVISGVTASKDDQRGEFVVIVKN